MCAIDPNIQNVTVQIDWTEVREWTKFAFIIFGGLIAIQGLSFTQKQRKLENGFKIIERYKQHAEAHISIFLEINDSVEKIKGEVSSVNYDFQYGSNNYNFSTLYSRNPPDDGAVELVTEAINRVCYAVLEKTVDHKIIIYELWIEIDIINDWLMKKGRDNESTDLAKRFSHIIDMHKKYKTKAQKLPKKNFVVT